MIVMKFGGASLANAKNIKNAGAIVSSSIKKRPLVVLSAIGKTTDHLITCGEKALKGNTSVSLIKNFHLKICDSLKIPFEEVSSLFFELEECLTEISAVKELTPRQKDYLVSFGERISVRIFSAYLNMIGIKAKFFDGWKAGFVTDSNAQNASILFESHEKIRKTFRKLKRKYIFTPVIAGFIGKDRAGHVTTFGRGGSDLTASVIGAALDAEEIIYWKDVFGIMSSDPKIVKNPVVLRKISFEEASEMAYFGAKIFHPQSILPAMEKNIPVKVKSFLDPQKEGTIILTKKPRTSMLVKAISIKKNVVLVDIVSTRMLGQHGFLARIFEVFNELKIPVDVVSTSEVSVSLTIFNTPKLDELKEKLMKIAKTNVEKGISIVSMVCDVKKSSKILAMVFSELEKEGINVKMISQGASKVNISFIVRGKDGEKCVKKLHSLFF